MKHHEFSKKHSWHSSYEIITGVSNYETLTYYTDLSKRTWADETLDLSRVGNPYHDDSPWWRLFLNNAHGYRFASHIAMHNIPVQDNIPILLPIFLNRLTGSRLPSLN